MKRTVYRYIYSRAIRQKCLGLCIEEMEVFLVMSYVNRTTQNANDQF